MNRSTGWALRIGTQWGHSASPAAGTAPLFSFQFASGFFTTMRPYLFFVSGITGLLGVALAPALPVTQTAVLAFVFFLTYGFGQALTDCFQTDTDAISSPYRPLVRGEIRRRDVLVISLGALLLSGWILVAFHTANLALAVLEIVGLLTYTWMKRRWWGGPPHNAWIVAVLVVMGFMAAHGAAAAAVVFDARVGWAMAATFFGYASFVVSGYHKDVEADRQTGYLTLPVRFGRRVSARTNDVLVAASIICTAVLIGIAPSFGHLAGLPALGLFLAGSLIFVTAERRLHRSCSDQDAHRAIAPIVHAYLLTMAAGTAAHRPAWTLFLISFYLLFVMALRARPMRAQI